MIEFYKYKVESGEINIEKVPSFWRKKVDIAIKKSRLSKPDKLKQ